MSEATAAKSNPLDPAAFKPAAVSAETLAANEAFRKAMSGGPDWWDIGALTDSEPRMVPDQFPGELVVSFARSTDGRLNVSIERDPCVA